MTYVKICGLTNLDDALAALDAGADYLGFIFYHKSPRYVTIGQVENITAKLPETTRTVGVFIDAPLETIYDARHRCKLHLIQLHGAETPLTVQTVGPAYKALRPASMDEWEQLAAIYAPSASRKTLDEKPEDKAPTLLIDAYHLTLHGGTGLTVDKELALAANARTSRLMLAGGLTPDNVGDVVRAVHPFAIDVSSGVEFKPGRKDYNKLRAFIQKIRDIDKELGDKA